MPLYQLFGGRSAGKVFRYTVTQMAAIFPSCVKILNVSMKWVLPISAASVAVTAAKAMEIRRQLQRAPSQVFIWIPEAISAIQ